MIRKTVAGILATAALLAPGAAAAKNVEGVEFAESAQAAGAAVKLVGVGVRVKWMMNVYVLGVYSASGKKSSASLTGADEAKLLSLHMLRGVSGEKMRSAIDEGMQENNSEAELARLRPDIDRLKAALPNDFGKGMVVQFVYVPGRGTVVKVGSAEKATIAGKPFMTAFWSIWFGRSPADKGLRNSVLE